MGSCQRWIIFGCNKHCVKGRKNVESFANEHTSDM